MGVVLKISFLLFLPLVLGFLLVILVAFGLIVLGGMLILMTKEIKPLLLVVGIVLFLVLCSLFRGLSYGGYSCLAGLLWCAFRR